MSKTPKRVWVNPSVEYAERQKQYGCNVEYHRVDLSADLVRAGYLAGLEAAATAVYYGECGEPDVSWMAGPEYGFKRGFQKATEELEDKVRTLSPDPEAVATIVAQVMEKE